MEMQDAEEFVIESTSENTDKEQKKPRPIVRTAVDLQRLKLEKLMKNPDKPVIIPETAKEKDFLQSVPSFVRNVMGSSAGAGSGEFHVYRHLRRKEYARQKHIQAKSMREQLDDEFQAKLEQNRLVAEEKTAKKRAKRQKKRQRMKQRGKRPKTSADPDVIEEESTDESSNDEEQEEKHGKSEEDKHEKSEEEKDQVREIEDKVVDHKENRVEKETEDGEKETIDASNTQKENEQEKVKSSDCKAEVAEEEKEIESNQKTTDEKVFVEEKSDL